MELRVRLPVIGVVRTSHHDLETTPIQAGLNRTERGAIEIAEPYRDGLDGLGGFDYLGCSPGCTARPTPKATRRCGRSRSSCAPSSAGWASSPPAGPAVNPVGLSLIQLLEVTCQAVVFAGVDLLDGTPVIDLKPYVTRFDRPPGNPRCGWFDEITFTDGITPEQLGAHSEPSGN